jgi:hypothetical protein
MMKLHNYIRNFRMFLRLTWKMFHANNTFGGYHGFVKRTAKETIRQSHLLNDGSIPDRTYKKIQWYMAEAVIMGEMLARLADHSISKQDKDSLIFLGAIMALFDAIIDDFRLDRAAVLQILENTFSPVRGRPSPDATAVEKVYYLYLDKLTRIIEKEQWAEISDHLTIIKLQMDSAEQYQEEISEEMVIGITLGKGGVAALICSAFLPQKNDSFRKAVSELGGFIQMMNDCQDIHKDTVAGIKTFVHFRKNFRDIFNRLDEQRRKTFQMIKSLDCSCDGRSSTLFDLNAMFIVIAYKLQRYAEACNYRLDYKAISDIEKKEFRINPFSPRSVVACFGKIMRFDIENCDTTPVFKFEQS